MLARRESQVEAETRALTRPAAFLALLISLFAAAVAVPPGALAILSPAANVPSGTFSFVATVSNSSPNTGFCTGTLVSPRWILTSNQCTYFLTPVGTLTTPLPPWDLIVRVGNTVRDTGGQVRAVTRILRKTSIPYGALATDVLPDDDIALLELSSPILNITPVALATPDLIPRWDGTPTTGTFPAKDQGIVVGWGLNATGGTPPAQLQDTGVNIWARNVNYGPYITADNVLCPGDTGGPLLISWAGRTMQAGVASGAQAGGTLPNCGKPYRASTFTDVGAGSNHNWVAASIDPAYNPAFTPFGVADWNKDGVKDIIARDDTSADNGDLYVYLGPGTQNGRIRIGAGGWNPYTPFGVADFTGDGRPDVLVRNDNTGDLWLYPGNGGVLTDGSTMIGHTGWNEFSPYGIANMNSDGYPDLLTRNDATGQLYVYFNNGIGGLYGSSVIGNNFDQLQPFGIGDYDGDGNPDVYARDNNTGTVWMYPFSRSSVSFGARSQITNISTAFTPFGVANYNADLFADVIVRDDTSRILYLYPGKLAACGRTFSTTCSLDAPTQIGSGW
jgi:hypothetical protein